MDPQAGNGPRRITMDRRLLPGESLSGYLSRLAKRAVMLTRHVLDLMGFENPAGTLRNWRELHYSMGRVDLERISEWTGVDPDHLAGRQLSAYADTWFDGQPFAEVAIDSWASKPWISLDEQRFCESCVDSGTMLLFWSLNVAAVCETHHTLLRNRHLDYTRYRLGSDIGALRVPEAGPVKVSDEFVGVQRRVRGWVESGDPAMGQKLRDLRRTVRLVLGVVPCVEELGPEIAESFARFVVWREATRRAKHWQLWTEFIRLVNPGVMAAAVWCAVRLVDGERPSDAVVEFVSLVNEGPEPGARWERAYGMYRCRPPVRFASLFRDAILESVGPVPAVHRDETADAAVDEEFIESVFRKSFM